MPIYEFVCKDCNKKFEQLCRIDWQGQVKCPGCGSDNIKKILSLFASKGSSSCNSCSGGNCSGCH